MKIETPQISWHGCESDNGRNAPLLSLAMLESGLDELLTSHSPSSKRCRYGNVIATAGNDSVVHLWKLSFRPTNQNTTKTSGCHVEVVEDSTFNESGAVIKHLISLNRHERSVNAVKFSPDGLTLATAGDGGSIVLWSIPPEKRGNDNGRHFWCEITRESDLVCRVIPTGTSDGSSSSGGGCEDIFDLSWSPCATRFTVCSLDHCVLVFEHTGKAWKCVARNRDHTHYVQGVSYDPMGVYVASQGSDRTVRVYAKRKNRQGNKFDLSKTSTAKYWAEPESSTSDDVPNSEDKKGSSNDVMKAIENITNNVGNVSSTETNAVCTNKNRKKPRRHLFADETSVESFFRRLCWTTDGAFLVTPAGLGTCRKDNGNEEATGKEDDSFDSFGTYLFARHRFDQPVAVLSGLKKPSVAVRPCPVLFELPKSALEEGKENSPQGVRKVAQNLPYRSIFAVLTLDTIFIYDTYHSYPLAKARGLHYAGLTDCAWTDDGRNLVVTSSDGYISILSFEEGELGQVYTPPKKVEIVVDRQSQDTVRDVMDDVVVVKSRIVPVEATLPPCSPGQSATLVAPHAKRAKKTIVPTLLSGPTESALQPQPDANTAGTTPKVKGVKRRVCPTLITEQTKTVSISVDHEKDDRSKQLNTDPKESLGKTTTENDEMDTPTPSSNGPSSEKIPSVQQPQEGSSSSSQPHVEHTQNTTKDVLLGAVTDLTLNQPKPKKKKRIQPTLLTSGHS